MSSWNRIKREEILSALREWGGPTLAAAIDLRMSVEELNARILSLGILPMELDDPRAPAKTEDK
jgi:hypothetical protein